MMEQGFVNSVISFFNLGAVYYVIQLIRCVLISYVVYAFVFLLRKTLLKDKVFLKGAIWSLFIPVIFVGKLKFYYENKVGVIGFSWWTGYCINHVWVDWLYLCGIAVYAAWLFYKKRKLTKLVKGMERRMVEGTPVYVAQVPITPFAIGIFRPRIVMPEVMLREYDREELQWILLHEKTHIRLGHLLLYFLWDVLRVLLWLNPLLTKGTTYFHEDMEDICDYVTIKRSKKKAYGYGKLLIKSMKILQTEGNDFNMYATFAGDKEYQDIRQRVIKIVRYRPYKWIATCILAVSVLCVIGAVLFIKGSSYDRYNEDDSMYTYGYDGKGVTFFDDSDALHQMISYDDSYVYVDKEVFEAYLNKNKAAGDIFIVFGGFYKLPGIGGIGYSCCYEYGSEDKVVKIPYDNQINAWRVKLLKIL